MNPLLVLLLLAFALPPPAQTTPVDSLRQLLRQHPGQDTTRVRRLLALAAELRATDAPQATRLSQQALALARQLHDAAGEGEALLSASIGHRRQNQFEPALAYALRAQRLYERRADRSGQGKSWLQVSLVHMLQGNLTPAVAAALKGLPLAEKAGDALTKTRLQANLGNTYFVMGSYDEAVPMLRAVLKSGQQTGDQQVVLTALNGLGNSYQNLKKWPQALGYYHRALALSRKLGDTSGETGNETSLAEVYGLQGNSTQALAHGLRARQLVQATHDAYNLPMVQLMLARAYLLARQPDSALALAHHGLALSQQPRNADNIRKAADILAEAYARRGNFEQAYRYRNLHMAYNDTLSGEDTQRRTSALRYSYELDKKQAQIDLLTKTRQLQAQTAARQRQQLYGLLAGLVGAVLIAALLLRNIFLKRRTNRHLNEKNLEIATHRDTLGRTLTELQATQARPGAARENGQLGRAHRGRGPRNPEPAQLRHQLFGAQRGARGRAGTGAGEGAPFGGRQGNHRRAAAGAEPKPDQDLRARPPRRPHCEAHAGTLPHQQRPAPVHRPQRPGGRVPAAGLPRLAGQGQGFQRHPYHRLRRFPKAP
ncbi:tetratricopeptide repeat protein [Hymenobacter humi]|uniref:Tetratricopeptide repeat protein n=1 Tax=Hymenobacter humi TaxID=1411620 RepID=A0ABW2U6I7_9BACT